MKKTRRPYRKFLEGVVKTRKYLIRTGRSRKNGGMIQQTIMEAEDLLMRMPSEESVKRFMQRKYVQIRALIPAKGNDDKRYQTLDQLVHA
jgi:hypothetical protein